MNVATDATIVGVVVRIASRPTASRRDGVSVCAAHAVERHRRLGSRSLHVVRGFFVVVVVVVVVVAVVVVVKVPIFGL